MAAIVHQTNKITGITYACEPISYWDKEKVGISGLTNEVINLTLEHGKHHTNYELEAFIQKCRILLPAEWALKRVRIDSGGFDIDNLNYLDQRDLEFLIKCKKYKSLQLLIDSVN